MIPAKTTQTRSLMLRESSSNVDLLQLHLLINPPPTIQVTSVPAPPVQEGPGAVASDSLAAESYRQQGSFASNPNATPSSVKGSSSTLNNTDTSSAKTLPPAPDNNTREAQEAQSQDSNLKGPGGLKYPDAAGGQPDFPGSHSRHGYYGGPDSERQQQMKVPGEYTTGLGQKSSGGGSSAPGGSDTDQQSHTSSGEQYRANANADPAPTYVGSVTGDFRTPDHLKPKGRNVQEVGDLEGENVSFTADIGSEKDPGRLAERRFQGVNAQPGQDAGRGPRQGGVESGGVGYGNLNTDEQA